MREPSAAAVAEGSACVTELATPHLAENKTLFGKIYYFFSNTCRNYAGVDEIKEINSACNTEAWISWYCRHMQHLL
jgi:hypothetical protein